MKKLFILAISAIIACTAFVSCDKTTGGSGSNDSTGSDSAAAGKVDTIATRIAFLSAGQVKLGTQDSAVSKTFNEEEYLKGFEEVFKQDNSYLAGREAAEQVKLQMRQLELQLGITIDKDVFLSEYKRVLTSKDTLSVDELQKVNLELSEILRAKAMEAQKAAGQQPPQ